MPIVLFAILGANANVGAGFWICFAIYSVLYVVRVIYNAAKEM